MGEDKKDAGVLSDLAEIADKLTNVHYGTTAVIFELERDEYYPVLKYFREVDRNAKKFKIDISGVEFIYILKEQQPQ
jgi:hypothetical protein|tara:strand:+ start:962 stop:1192 length:231 start_codon:yes stop_codon:yes gene_type:complete